MPSAVSAYKLLIVDDEPMVSESLALLFSTRGYETRVAYSAEQAIEIIAEWQPDLAIVDVILPQMNGIDLAIVLKANYPLCRSVLFSGQPFTSEILEEMTKKGHTFEVLAKPVDPAFLLEMIGQMRLESEASAPFSELMN
ncbi:response regulator [Alloacidobacterium sp.]|uniref:response regulator n=1 Tax=Alloacidobacterium sp. TaxID=2951999 RepID=UPI002D525308|nr:response regulator [Alloacidobacterium sp.]HYK37730.1 response regulator [Alloacidobacterium sp.]